MVITISHQRSYPWDTGRPSQDQAGLRSVFQEAAQTRLIEEHMNSFDPIIIIVEIVFQKH